MSPLYHGDTIIVKTFVHKTSKSALKSALKKRLSRSITPVKIQLFRAIRLNDNGQSDSTFSGNIKEYIKEIFTTPTSPRNVGTRFDAMVGV